MNTNMFNNEIERLDDGRFQLTSTINWKAFEEESTMNEKEIMEYVNEVVNQIPEDVINNIEEYIIDKYEWNEELWNEELEYAKEIVRQDNIRRIDSLRNELDEMMGNESRLLQGYREIKLIFKDLKKELKNISESETMEHPINNNLILSIEKSINELELSYEDDLKKEIEQLNEKADEKVKLIKLLGGSIRLGGELK